jgi:broad specificity phosphatase PhoE
MTEIYLLRHGDTGLPHVLVGATDVPLAAHARAGLQESGRLLSAIDFDHIWCSPMLRCRETLASVLPGAKAEMDDNLREVDFGLWEMLKFPEISKQYPDDVARLAAWDAGFAFPGGESIASYLARVAAIQARVAAACAGHGQKILLITHSGIIRQLLCGWLGISSRQYLLFAVEFGKIARLSLYKNGGVLNGFNLG